MSRAERRRAQQAARRKARYEEALAAKRARDARARERDARFRARHGPEDDTPLLIKIARFPLELFLREWKRDFWFFAGVTALAGRAMGIDTRDPRLPAWTGLNQSPGKPDQGARPGGRPPEK